MMMEWLVYSLVVSSLVGAAAWLAERGVWGRGWRVRWVWAAAMVVSVALPVATWVSPGSVSDTPPVVAVPGAFVLESLPVVQLQAAASAGASAEVLALTAWGIVSGALLLLMALLSVRLRLLRRRWPVRTVEGVEVLVSERTGPAAMGVWRGRVVVPEWALELSASQRRLLVLHEAEHVRAGDPRLALAGLIVWALAPWNVPLWWQLRRLRLAIEVDCDARVLRQTADARGYGALLLEVGQHRAHLALALAEPKSMLERRIRMITEAKKGRGVARALGLAAAAALVLAVACETPGPMGPTEPTPASPERAGIDEGAEIEGAEVGEVVDRDLAARPAFTPMTDPPKLRNPDGIRAALVEHHPPLLRGAGIGGTASVWLFVRKTGEVEKVLVRESSGHEALDSAAVRVAWQMEFDPAYNGDAAVPAWVALPITFASAVDAPREAADRRAETVPQAGVERQAAAAETQDAEVAREPTFTPMTAPPRLRSPEEMQRLLLEAYPPMLGDAGIGGTASVWFFIDEVGRVVTARIRESSGHEALDEAALAVARRMDFEPARNGEQPVAVWVALDISFEPQ